MRLLCSSHPYLKFESFDDDRVVPGEYIVLSHVWQNVEQPYDEFLCLEREATAADDPRISIKVRECHRLARAHGFGWFWVDAPCIDHRNSAELSEAIASMYRWYANASICFAHLPDVPSHDRIRDPGSAFRRSIYFRRGWTLQELIAPRRVIFLFSDWTVLGEKHELADLLEEITGIDQDVLTFRQPVADVSVARRLSWASLRETRRVEDQAYCLMGLFDIHMSMKYGEGDKAFLRLQQKILKKICDHTIFAWGAVMDILPSLGRADADTGDLLYPTTSLSAPSPAAFSRSRSMHPVDIEAFMASMEALAGDVTSPTKRMPRFSLDHYGLECHLPILCHGSNPVAAVLAFQDMGNSYIALALHPRGSRNALYSIRNLELAEPSSANTGDASQTPRLVRVPTGNYTQRPPSPAGWPSAASAGFTVQFMSIHIAIQYDPLPPISILSSTRLRMPNSTHLPRSPRLLLGSQASHEPERHEISANTVYNDCTKV